MSGHWVINFYLNNYLGILLYELFHRRAPFPGKNITEVMSKITKNSIKFKKGLDQRIKDLILEILKHNPEDRPFCSEILKNKNLISLIQEYHLDQPKTKSSYLNSLAKLT